MGSKLRKGLKVVNQTDKSPYINNCFDKSAVNQTSASSNNSESASSSVKANRKGAASAEISESSLIVLKKATKASVEGSVQTVNGISVKPVDNLKLMAAIQKMRKVNPASSTQIQSKNSTSVSN